MITLFVPVSFVYNFIYEVVVIFVEKISENKIYFDSTSKNIFLEDFYK